MDPSQIAIGVGLAAGLAGLGVGIGQGIAANGALNGMARQPEAAGKIQTAMIIGLAFSELVFILAWVAANGMVSKVPSFEQQKELAQVVSNK